VRSSRKKEEAARLLTEVQAHAPQKCACEAKQVGTHGVDWYSKRDHAKALSRVYSKLTPSGMGGFPP
jgi:hypothetical protein